jgi:hypothetical protein
MTTTTTKKAKTKRKTAEHEKAKKMTATSQKKRKRHEEALPQKKEKTGGKPGMSAAADGDGRSEWNEFVGDLAQVGLDGSVILTRQVRHRKTPHSNSTTDTRTPQELDALLDRAWHSRDEATKERVRTHW